MDSFFITFIVPVYKVDYNQLRRCIESILNQSGHTSAYEVLIIDDGSPDDCGNICEEYASKHKNVRVIHQENQGLSVVRNNGVKNALGEWISFVDGDDWIEPHFVAFAEKSVKEAPDDSDILIWDGYSETLKNSTPIKFMDTEDTSLMVFKGKDKEKIIDRNLPRKVSREAIRKCCDIGITWSRIYRRQFLTDNNIENVPGLKVMQDSVFNLWAFEYARTICYQYELLYHYSMYDESVSKKYDSHVSETMRMLNGYLTDYIKKCHDEEEYWQRLYIRTVRTLVKCLSKDYANPLNTAPVSERVEKMKKDLSAEEFQTALQNCDPSGQEFKFRFILFLLKHKMYRAAILTSQAFSWLRRKRTNAS